MIIVDRSSSMVTGFVDGKTKWEVATSAISQVASTYQSDIDIGLMVFPDPNACAPGTVKVAIGPQNAQAIINELSTPPPNSGNWTPMAQTLDAATTLVNLQDQAYSNNVLVITDGWQWCDPYDPQTRFLPVNSTANLKAVGITTYVVGFGDSVDALTLNKMADTAGTKISPTCDAASNDITGPNNCYYQANNPNELLTVLQTVAQKVAAEKCDNQDNDCNGLVDDNLTRACQTTCGGGYETCLNGAWINCSAPTPQAEVCDGKDNNCDGTVDEGCTCTAGQTRPCGINEGQCKQGVQTCSNGTWGNCAGETKPSVEICDGADNDCNGAVDDGLTRTCQTECGTGTETCSFGSWNTCTAPQPGTEICDGMDNDCDGTVDGANAVCSNGGVCVNGTCQPKSDADLKSSNGEGCDCGVGHGPQPGQAPLVLLLALAFLVLLARPRKR